jgi:hypothetical protein
MLIYSQANWKLFQTYVLIKQFKFPELKGLLLYQNS